MSTISTEQQILYVLLTEPSSINECQLSSSDFTNQTDQLIFQTIQDISSEGMCVDMVTVGERLESNQTSINMDYFIDIVNNGYGSRNNLSSYVGLVKKGSRKRQARSIAYDLIESIERGGDGDLVGEAIKNLMSIDNIEKNYNYSIKQCLNSGLQLVDEAFKSGGLVGISTGLNDLDKVLGGYHKTDLIVVGARPAMGKTAFLFSSALGSNSRAGIISAEQGHEQAGLRCISIQGSVDSSKLRTGRFDSQDEWSKVSASTVSLQDRPIWINDMPSISITNLVKQAREWKFKNNIDILFVDYIQKIKGSRTNMNKLEQVTEVTGTLKNLARELDIPVVALAQVKRDVESRNDKRPNMGDMSDASEIEKEADQIITLYRDEVYDEQSEYKGVAELDVVKNRHGPIGCIRARFIGQYFQFKDLSVNYDY